MVAFDFRRQIGFVRFIGTHAQYDAIDALTKTTVRYADAVYVLHAFQKKSKKGIAAPKAEIALIEQRLKSLIDDKESRR